MSGACPSAAVLEEAAEGGAADASVRAHLAECVACRAAVEEIRANNRFLRLFSPPGGPGTTPKPEEPEKPVSPDLLAGYTIKGEVHRGGQGIVYLAVQEKTGRTAAVKMLLNGARASGRQRERFEREARIAAGLRHPNIVTIYDVTRTSDGRYGLAMEFIEGDRLDRWRRSPERQRGKEGLRERLEVMAKVCDGVLCAHQHAVVHRDLKPANILVDKDGEPHILDFGIARNIGGERTRLTYTGEFAGTLAYASPEQVSGDPSRVDTRADIYSLGVILYEVVGGGLPYQVEGPIAEAVRNIQSGAPAPLARRARQGPEPRVDDELSTIILKALAKEPERRYQTAAELRDDLRRYLAGEPIEARRDSTWYVLRKTASRYRLAFSAAALVFVLLLAFAVAMAWEADRLEARGRELQAALGASRVERARLLAAAGETDIAERMVWPELMAAGVRSLDGDRAMFAGSPEALNAYWALWDVFRRTPRVASFRTPARSDTLSYFDLDGRSVHVLDVRGSLWTLLLPGLESPRNRLLFPVGEPGRLRAAVSPDQRGILAFGDGRVRLADPATGVMITERDDAEGRFEGAAFSPDGTLIATIGRDGVLRLADARSLEVRRDIASGAVAGIGWDLYSSPAFSPDGTLIAAAQDDASVGLWRIEDGELITRFGPPESLRHFVGVGLRPTALAFDSDGRRLGAGVATYAVVWDVAGTSPPVVLGPHAANVTSVRFFGPGDGLLLAGVRYVRSAIWDLDRREVISSPGRADHCTSISADGRWILTASSERLWLHEGRSESHMSVLHEGGGFGGGIAVSRDGRTAAFVGGPGGGRGHDIALIDLVKRRTVGELHGCRSEVVGIEFSPDGAWLYTGEVSGRVLKWDLRSRTVEREFREGAAVMRREFEETAAICLSPDGGTLALAEKSGGVTLLNPENGEPNGRLEAGPDPLCTLAFGLDGQLLAGQDLSGTCWIWNAGERRLLRSARAESGKPNGRVLRFSADGREVGIAVPGGGLRFLDVNTGVLRTIADARGRYYAVVVHPGGRVLFASNDRAINLLDSQTGARLLSLESHQAPAVSIALCPDGRTLLSADLSGTLLAWDLDYYAPHIKRALEERLAEQAR